MKILPGQTKDIPLTEFPKPVPKPKQREERNAIRLVSATLTINAAARSAYVGPISIGWMVHEKTPGQNELLKRVESAALLMARHEETKFDITITSVEENNTLTELDSPVVIRI